MRESCDPRAPSAGPTQCLVDSNGGVFGCFPGLLGAPDPREPLEVDGQHLHDDRKGDPLLAPSPHLAHAVAGLELRVRGFDPAAAFVELFEGRRLLARPTPRQRELFVDKAKPPLRFAGRTTVGELTRSTCGAVKPHDHPLAVAGGLLHLGGVAFGAARDLAGLKLHGEVGEREIIRVHRARRGGDKLYTPFGRLDEIGATIVGSVREDLLRADPVGLGLLDIEDQRGVIVFVRALDRDVRDDLDGVVFLRGLGDSRTW